MEKDQILNGKAPAWKVIVHLMDEYPEHWRISLPDARHMPSGLVVRLDRGQAFIVNTGNVGIKISPWRAYAIHDAINRLIAAKLLMSSRKATLDGTDFDQRDEPERASPSRISSSPFNPFQTHPLGQGGQLFPNHLQEMYAKEIMDRMQVPGRLLGNSTGMLSNIPRSKP